jgi:hypothetical protein
MVARLAVAKAASQSKTAQTVGVNPSEYSAQQSKSAHPESSQLPKIRWNICDIPTHAPNQRSQPNSVRGDGRGTTPRLGWLPWPMQAKIEVGAVNDPLEREADQVAEKVMRMPDAGAFARPSAKGGDIPRVLRSCACGGKCADCQKRRFAGEDPEQLQSKRINGSDGGPAQAPASVYGVLRSSGQPLDAATRAFMEPRFGRDFSRVRVHSNAVAQQSARPSLYARAEHRVRRRPIRSYDPRGKAADRT